MKNKKPAYRNTSPFGWWIGSYIEQAVWDDDPNPSPEKPCLAWENTIIFRAPDREKAYSKMLQLCRNSSAFENEDKTRTGHWIFLGVSDLLPIYEELEDGAEILWREHKRKSVKSVRSLVKTKEELSLFKD